MKEHKCDICGRMVKNKIKSHGYVLCYKHYNQFKKYGKFLDNNPRTMYDPNEIRVENGVAYISLYNKQMEKIAETMVDIQDLPKVQYTKWRMNCNGYVINNSKFNNGTKFMHREVLGCKEGKFVDHINHNKLDNRRSNLRIVTKSQNQMNCNYKGVNKRKDGRYYAHIKLNGKMLNLGIYIDKEEAYYARWYAEKILFKEYRYPKEKPFILKVRETEIEDYVNRKVQRL